MSEILNHGIENKKIVIYSAGKLLERHVHFLNWDNVMAVVDADENKQGKYIKEKMIEKPDRLLSAIYDYVLIFTDKYFTEIKDMLIGYYFVSEDKIASWRMLFNEHTIISDEIARLYEIYIADHTPCNILDAGSWYGFGSSFIQLDLHGAKIDFYGQKKFALYDNLYDEYIMEGRINKKYDIVFLFKDYGGNNIWDMLIPAAKSYIIWTIPHCDRVSEKYLGNIARLSHWGNRRFFLFPQAVVYVFKKKGNEEPQNRCKIFMAVHKKFNVLSNDTYKPICVGTYQNRVYYSDHAGKNIAYLNDRINECTALYWIWKNTTFDYVGLSHYRRYLCNNEIVNGANYLTGEKAIEIFLGGYDIILPELTRLPVTVLSNIRNSIGEELCGEAMKIIRGLMVERSPDYIGAFEYIMSGNVFYKCQIFVTRRSLLDDYCRWLFSFLVDAAEMLDVSRQDAHHKRTIGYFAETMLTVWLMMQSLNIKELPLIEI